MLQVFINGPPGVGKTTICKLLCAELRLVHVATGDLLRENMAQATDLGRIAKQCIAAKSLVPDHVVVDMVAEKILECNLRGQGWVLDGFPRTTEQTLALRRKQIFPCIVVILDLCERECIERITGRRIDTVTNEIYHALYVRPRDSLVLSRLQRRSDDTVDKFAPRMQAYRTYGVSTNALFDNVAHHISAAARPERVLDQITELLHALRPTSSWSNSIRRLHTSAFQSTSNQNLLTTAAVPKSVGKSQHHIKAPAVPHKIEEEDENQVDEDDSLPTYNYEDHEEPIATEIKSSPAPETVISTNCLQTAVVPDSTANVLEPSPSIIMTNSSTAQAGSVDMFKFKEMLLDGFEALKHGRRGSPHMRMVFTDMEFKRIFWQKPSAKDKPKRAKLDQSIVLSDVLQVVRGMKTDVLKRSGDVAKYERYLSLVTDDRTLDLEFPTDAKCEFFVQGFDQLLSSQ